MLYCAKCRSVCQDGAAKCPNCKSPRLRAADGDDLVLLHRAGMYAAQLMAERFDKEEIVYEMAPVSTGWTSFLYDPEALPTDKNVLVRYADLKAAQEISAAVKEELDKEQNAAPEEAEDMPVKKRILVQIFSALAFLVLVTLVVLSADAVANWLKGLFGL